MRTFSSHRAEGFPRLTVTVTVTRGPFAAQATVSGLNPCLVLAQAKSAAKRKLPMPEKVDLHGEIIEVNF